MADSRRAPTLQDVARRVGVHPATVSRALNRPDQVAPQTREKVLATVTAIGFVPNESARRLAGGRAEAIGVLIPDIANPYFAAVLQVIQAQAAHRQLAVLIADTGGDPMRETHMLESLSRRVDGLVALTPVTDLSGAGVPVVQVNRLSRDVPGVVVDQSAVVTLAIDHLVDLGHHRIAYLRGPTRYWSTRRRSRAVEKINRTRHSSVQVDVVHPVPADFAGGLSALKGVRATGATGVIAFNDLQAAGVLAAARDAGIAVPEELSVVGSDGLAMSATTAPALTTVAAPLNDMGVAAIGCLLDGRATSSPVVVQPRLEIRASTAAASPTTRSISQPGSNHARTG